ncbi:MAG TPA: hypothetical protein VFE90_16415, partial [Myxococcales bacterium]|nr:hypothetical protein [Myxococcales bacterium]
MRRCASAKAVTSTTGARTSALRSAGMSSMPDMARPSPRTTSATTASTKRSSGSCSAPSTEACARQFQPKACRRRARM